MDIFAALHAGALITAMRMPRIYGCPLLADGVATNGMGDYPLVPQLPLSLLRGAQGLFCAPRPIGLVPAGDEGKKPGLAMVCAATVQQPE